MTLRPANFLRAAIGSFPPSYRMLATVAAKTLEPFVDNSYHAPPVPAVVLGEIVQIPRRIHFLGMDEKRLQIQGKSWSAIQCLSTRSTDGYIRQASLRRILAVNESWAIPFVVLLAGEYVAEIVEDMVVSLPALDRDAYANFVRENRPLVRRLRSKATSYWNCYYRSSYPDRSSYPGLTFLHQLEVWAS